MTSKATAMMTKDTDKQRELEQWLKGRPECIKQMARNYPPWQKYRIKSTGQECVLYSYAEDGTVTVNITSFTLENLMGEQRQVFGIDFSDLDLLAEVTDE